MFEAGWFLNWSCSTQLQSTWLTYSEGQRRGRSRLQSVDNVPSYCTVLCCAVHTYSKRRASEMNQIKGVWYRPGQGSTKKFKVKGWWTVDTRPSLWRISITIPTRMRLATGDLYSKQNSRRDATMNFGLKSHYTLGCKGKRRKEKKGRWATQLGYDDIQIQSRCGNIWFIVTSRYGFRQTTHHSCWDKIRNRETTKANTFFFFFVNQSINPFI